MTLSHYCENLWMVFGPFLKFLGWICFCILAYFCRNTNAFKFSRSEKYRLYFSLLLIILVGVAIDIILLGFYKAWSMQ
jgi:hypothetical protein